MIHSKSKSNKLKITKNEDPYIDKSITNKSNVYNENNSTTINQMSATKDNFDLNLIPDDNEVNMDKISNLFYDPDIDDKIVNISKLDEDLYSNDRKTKRIGSQKNFEHSDSHIGLVLQNEIEISRPIINMSVLDMENNLQTNEINDINNQNNVNTNDNNRANIINSNKINHEKDISNAESEDICKIDSNNKKNAMNTKNKNNNIIKIMKTNNNDEIFVTKKKKCIKKIFFKVRNIVILFVILFLIFINFFLLKEILK